MSPKKVAKKEIFFFKNALVKERPQKQKLITRFNLSAPK